MNSYIRYLPWFALTLTAVYILSVSAPPADAGDGMKFTEFARLPVNDGGRIKPLDTLARINLMIISDRQAFHDAQGNPAPAVEWLLDVMTATYRNVDKWGGPKHDKDLAIRNSPGADKKSFRIEDPVDLKDLELTPSPTNLYAYKDFAPSFKNFAMKNRETIRKAMERERIERNQGPLNPQQLEELGLTLTPQEQERVNFFSAVSTYESLALHVTDHHVFRITNLQVLSLLNLEPRSGWRYGIDEFVCRLADLNREAMRAEKADDKSAYGAQVFEVNKHVGLYLKLTDFIDSMLLVPPVNPGGEWATLVSSQEQQADQQKDGGRATGPEADALFEMLAAYVHHDVSGFNTPLKTYQDLLEKRNGYDTRKVPFETFFNHFMPFYQCMILYPCVFLLGICAWIGYRTDLTRTAFWMLLATLAVHTFGVVSRIYISGYAPVMNLYSSAIFIGWGCVSVTAVLEAIFGNGFAVVVGSVLGFITTIIAYYLSQSGDTLEMLVAVLDTNFWLSTHVTSVTFGYVATFVAGFLGMTYIGVGLFSRVLDKPTSKALYHMTYGVVCFATLMSFLGTVLGGIWADQSWGRFWGWDPKENGALLIVIWNAILLHARWGGLAKERGVAVLAVAGNIVCGWSWFGTNLLGVGLHNYGFMHGAFVTLLVCDAVFLGFIGLGLLPLRFWRSFGGDGQIPGFRPLVLPAGTLPSLSGAGGPAVDPTSIEDQGENKHNKKDRNKH